MAYDWTKHVKNTETKKCPRCKKIRNIKGFKKNPDTKFNNEICWNCYRQVKYHIDQNEVCDNVLGITIERAKELVYSYYGKLCNCCGETEVKFLEIDHVDNNGAEHRQMLGKLSIYVWIVNNNFPANFQILCANCNVGKYRNGGTCPHKNILKLVVNI